MLQDSKFVVANKMGVMNDDALSSSHAVIVPRSSPDEIKQSFDDITYIKVHVIIHDPHEYSLIT